MEEVLSFSAQDLASLCRFLSIEVTMRDLMP